jgi:hypothetical protein
VTVRNLSVNAENKVKMVQEGALKPLIALLRSKHEFTQEQAAMALRNLSINATNEHKMVAEGAIPAVRLSVCLGFARVQSL